MAISTLYRKLNDTSISKKLYFTIGFTALLVTIELCTLWFSITTLSAVRSYVGGEGLWSKAQKDALLKLRTYAYSHDEADYAKFTELLKVPLGDKAARIELEKPSPDYALARKKLLEGKNHPDDIDGMIKLLRRFHNIYYLKKAFVAWAEAEPALQELIKIGAELHILVQNDGNGKQIDLLLTKIDLINRKLTVLEDNFSYSLGEGARWLEQMVLRIVLALSLTIGITSILIAISINRNLKKGVYAIIRGADLIRNGELKTRVQVYSKDEIGKVANAFNEMTNTLEKNIHDLRLAEDNMLKQKERAEYSEKAKQDFLINMSHEMRTPMNAILGFARYLHDSPVNKEQLECIQMMIKSGDHLLMTLNDILDFSTIETGKINFIKQAFNTTELIGSVIKSIGAEATQKQLEISAEIDHAIPKVVYGDSGRLTQILLTLASNSLKFTTHGSINITAILISDGPEEALIEFRVKDTGIGIPLEKQDRIFNIFEQATNGMKRKFGGTGIGLSIVKHLITLQRGNIWVTSAPDRGAEFRFRLPFLKQGIMGTSAPNTGVGSGKGIRVLVIEDNVINQMLVLKLLKKHGYETSVAENGKVALRKYKEEDFDIMLMDLQMPEMDGYETTENIRKMRSYKKNIPIVAMTAHTVKGDFEKCMALGMDAYISKPFHPCELYEKIQLLVVK
ncbi:response regulator [Pedobacter metabolipauper]|uniref:histidine kinase n=1 Tax=Pedobacter metabolipauper TaxID=425513 RepID=A0A4R6SS26_9SPHI|nr:response regulator [Pedobacter metabolipauper]TDQ07403.1 hypothetical protein ATK78_3524 [Pedobacter metabolipauper]